jgi:hypothetical protein
VIAILIFFLILLQSCAADNKNILHYEVAETEDAIITAPLIVVYEHGKVAIVDQTGRAVYLYKENGELLRSFEPQLYMSDSLLAKSKKYNQTIRYVTTQDYEAFYPDSYKSGSLENMLGNKFVNCSFLDSNKFTIAVSLGVLVQSEEMAANKFAITCREGVVNYDLSNDNISYTCFHFTDSLDAMTTTDSYFYSKNRNVYITGFKESIKKQNSFPCLAAVDANGNIKETYLNTPSELNSEFLSTLGVIMSEDRQANVWAAFPFLTKIYNIKSNYSFDLQIPNNTNKKYLDTIRKSKLTRSQFEELNKTAKSYVKYEITGLFHDKEDNLIVIIEDYLANETITIQQYSPLGELLKSATLPVAGDFGKIAVVAYSKEEKKFVFVNSIDQKWYFIYKPEKEIF